MFVTKRHHNEVVKQLEARIEDLSCREVYRAKMYDGVVELLQGQISDLKKLIFIPKHETTREAYEVDGVISGSDKPAEVSEEEHNRLLELARESDLIISGNYAEDLLQ